MTMGRRISNSTRGNHNDKLRPAWAPLALSLSLAASAGCTGKKPSEAQCQAFADHFIELLKKDNSEHKVKQLADKHRDRILELCVEQGTAAEVECAMAAETLEQIEKDCK